jgi:hypothetical protein
VTWRLGFGLYQAGCCTLRTPCFVGIDWRHTCVTSWQALEFCLRVQAHYHQRLVFIDQLTIYLRIVSSTNHLRIAYASCKCCDCPALITSKDDTARRLGSSLTYSWSWSSVIQVSCTFDMENDFSRQHLATFSAGSCLCGFADACGLGWCGNCGLLQSRDTSLDFLDAIADQNFHGTVPQCLLLGDIGSNLYIDPSHTLQTASRDPDPDLAPVTPTARQVSRAETNSQYAFETCRSMHHDAQWSQRDPRLTGSTISRRTHTRQVRMKRKTSVSATPLGTCSIHGHARW